MQILILILCSLLIAPIASAKNGENHHKAFKDLPCEKVSFELQPDGTSKVHHTRKFIGSFSITLSEKVIAADIKEPSAVSKQKTGKMITPVLAEATVIRSENDRQPIVIKDGTVMIEDSSREKTKCTLKNPTDALEIEQILKPASATTAGL